MTRASEKPLSFGMPSLAPLPSKARRTLLDHGLLAFEASQAGFSERYRRGETPHTVHVWWARRPYSAMRALVYASLCDGASEDDLATMTELCASSSAPPLILAAARAAIARQFREPPKVLDMFGGGGTIPFEASLLGAEAYSIDSNELSVFVQKCLLGVVGKAGSALPELVRAAGDRVLHRLTDVTAPLYPQRGKVFGYLWTYSYPCRACGYRFLLSKRPWLSKKKGKRLAVVVRRGESRDETCIGTFGEGHESATAWVGRNGTACCPRCSRPHQGISVKDAADELVGLVGFADGRGKEFLEPGPTSLPAAGCIARVEREALKALAGQLPASRLPQWSGIVNPALYGIETHADFLHPRQRAVLLLLINELRVEYQALVRSSGVDTAAAVVGILSGLIDQQVDWNCRLSMWISQNEQVGRAFSGPGVAMLWDYVETDPVLEGPANLPSKLDRIVSGTRALSGLPTPVRVRKGYAQELPFTDGSFHAVVTDPPYYDNIYYSVLADFFYSWKRMLLANVCPDLFGADRTDCARELVASSFRSGGADAAHRDYCVELKAAVGEAERVLRDEGVFALVYSHASIRGWEALVGAYRPSGLLITSVQPLSIERKARPRAMTSEAVNTCVVFVAHKTRTRRRKTALAGLEARFRQAAEPIWASLRDSGWCDPDIGIAAYAQGVGLLSNCDGCTDADDATALRRLETVLREILPDFRVTARGSL
jgi:putative DNA methylase